jgi:hypothetical protein
MYRRRSHGLLEIDDAGHRIDHRTPLNARTLADGLPGRAARRPSVVYGSDIAGAIMFVVGAVEDQGHAALRGRRVVYCKYSMPS